MNNGKQTLLEKSKQFAINVHNEVNHKYDGHPYSFHLKMVVRFAERFVHLIPKEKKEVIFSGCWCHDSIEDCRQTPNDVMKATNEDVAILAFALTNEKGWLRTDRANAKYYEGIRNTPYATFIKLCDRIANATHGKNQEKLNGKPSRMLKTYREENEHFVTELYDPQYKEMFDYLEKLLTTK